MLGLALLLIPVSALAQGASVPSVESSAHSEFDRERARLEALKQATIASETDAPRRSGITPDALSLRFNFSLSDEPRAAAAASSLFRSVDLSTAADSAAWDSASGPLAFSPFRRGGEVDGVRVAPVAGSAPMLSGSFSPTVELETGAGAPASAFLPAGETVFFNQRPEVPLTLTTQDVAFDVERPPSSIPEPSTVALLGAGSLLLAWRAFRRRSAS